MTSEEINKSIRQMRQVFIAAGLINLIAFCVLGALSISNSNWASSTISSVLCLVPLVLGETACFWIAASGLEKHTSNAYMFALISSVLFIITFPVYTVFGIIYLNQLRKPAMKQVFGQPNPWIFGAAIGTILLIVGCPLLLILFFGAMDRAGLWCNFFPFIAGCG